jgi:hypothetical protein
MGYVVEDDVSEVTQPSYSTGLRGLISTVLIGYEGINGLKFIPYGLCP